MLLPGCLTATSDAADALAVAICHAHHAETHKRWQAAEAGA
jgi:crossover junction endodeoxyribonuclease RuvC